MSRSGRRGLATGDAPGLPLAVLALSLGSVALLLLSGPAASAAPGSSVASAAPGSTTATTAGGTGATTTPLSSEVVSSVPAGFTRQRQGQLTAPLFAGYAPDPTAAARLLRRLERKSGFTTYVRSWSTAGALNGITDLAVAFPTSADATAYLSHQQGSLATTPGVRKASVPGVPGGVRYTYLTAEPTDGVAQVVTLRTGRAAATLTFTSSDDPANTVPFTSIEAAAMSRRQYRLLDRSPYGGPALASGRTAGTVVGWVLLGLAVVVLEALLVLFHRRRAKGSGGTGDRPGLGPPVLRPAEP